MCSASASHRAAATGLSLNHTDGRDTSQAAVAAAASERLLRFKWRVSDEDRQASVSQAKNRHVGPSFNCFCWHMSSQSKPFVKLNGL
ncbi:hypothetical protein D3C86_1661560 [compost metagenome]